MMMNIRLYLKLDRWFSERMWYFSANLFTFAYWIH